MSLGYENPAGAWDLKFADVPLSWLAWDVALDRTQFVLQPLKLEIKVTNVS